VTARPPARPDRPAAPEAEDPGPATDRAVAEATAPPARPATVAALAERLRSRPAPTRTPTPTQTPPRPSAAVTPPSGPPPAVKDVPLPSSTSVRSAATEADAIRLDEMTLVGVFGSSGSRRALVRMPDGVFRRLARGDRIDGWQVTGIDDASVRLARGGDNRVLRLPR
jgi:hypothetical protein